MNLVLDTLRSRNSFIALGHVLGILASLLAFGFGELGPEESRLKLWALSGLGLGLGLLVVELAAGLLEFDARRLKKLAPNAFPFKNLPPADRAFLQAYIVRLPRRSVFRAVLAWALAAWGFEWAQGRLLPGAADAFFAFACFGLPVSAATQYLGNLAMTKRVLPFFFFEEKYAASLSKWLPSLGGRAARIALLAASPFLLSYLLGWASAGSLYADKLEWAMRLLLPLLVFGLLLFAGVSAFGNLAAQPLKDLESALNRFAHGDYGALLDVTSGDEVGHVTEAYNKAVRATDRRFFIQETFGHMVTQEQSPRVFEEGLKLDGEERDVAVLCARLGPAPLASFNKFCQLVMTEAAKDGGALDEVGEGMISAVFGAPFPMEKPGLAAARAAARLKEALPIFMTQQKMQAGVAVSASLAAAEGKATVGLAGPKGMQRYTALGGPAREARELSLKEGAWIKVAGLPAGFELDGEGRLLKGPAAESPDISKGIPGLGFQPGERL